MSERGELPPRLGELLGTVGSRAGIGDSKATAIVWAKWAEIVGAAVAGNAEPTSLRDGVLRVRATTPTWATELTYLGGEIRARANALVGREVVREVRVWTGPGRVAPATAATPERRVDGGSGATDQDPATEASGGDPADIQTAYERAHAAWFKRRSKGH